MEFNDVMNNDAIVETAENLFESASGDGLVIAACIGLGMIAGGVTYKFVVEPTVARIKIWKENKKDSKNGFDTFEEVKSENDSEESK